MLSSIKSDFLAIRLPGDCEPVGHRPPRPRIETSPVWPAPKPPTCQERLAELQRIADGERLWRFVQEAAGHPVAPQEPVEEAEPEPEPVWYMGVPFELPDLRGKVTASEVHLQPWAPQIQLEPGDVLTFEPGPLVFIQPKLEWSFSSAARPLVRLKRGPLGPTPAKQPDAWAGSVGAWRGGL